MAETTSEKALSIIVPCYKVEQYLPRCLDSLMAQTLEDIEVICINDGSPDGCLGILRDYEARYPDKIVIIDKQNEGVWRGRNDGIRIARGRYIGFLDSDDYAEPDFAERLYTAACGEGVDIAVSGFRRVDVDTGDVISQEMCNSRPAFSILEDPGRMLELNGASWNKVFRADLLKGMHDLKAPPPILEDLVFHLLVYLRMRGMVVFVDKALVNYVIRSGSIITSVRKEQVDKVLNAFREVKAIYLAEGATEAKRLLLDAEAFLHLGISLTFRLSYDASINLRRAIGDITGFLDGEFPTWRKSPYISLRYSWSRGPAHRRLLFTQKVYKAHLMPAFLAVYRFAIDKLGIEIKW